MSAAPLLTSPFGAPRARSVRRAARLVAAALRAGRTPDDAFDRFLPPELRDVSAQYWTPLRVVRQAAAWLRETQVRTVVDIGSGAGKFCVAAALLTRCRFVGLEKRASLVDASRELAGIFEVDDRVVFVNGNLGVTPAPAGDAYYFFNPFGEYAFYSRRFAEPGMALTPEAHARDVAAAAASLSRAPVGTFAITLNGFGGKVPAGYEQIDVARRLPGTLRLWKKQEPGTLQRSERRSSR
jgi:SAM-dependent methyltransferase